MKLAVSQKDGVVTAESFGVVYVIELRSRKYSPLYDKTCKGPVSVLDVRIIGGAWRALLARDGRESTSWVLLTTLLRQFKIDRVQKDCYLDGRGRPKKLSPPAVDQLSAEAYKVISSTPGGLSSSSLSMHLQCSKTKTLQLVRALVQGGRCQYVGQGAAIRVISTVSPEQPAARPPLGEGPFVRMAMLETRIDALETQVRNLLMVIGCR